MTPFDRRAAMRLGVLALALPRVTRAQGSAWTPSRSITFVVPFAPGGITDSGARVMAPAMARVLGQPVVVENRPGAGGTIGAESILRAPADGHMILYASQGPMAAAPSLFPNLRYDPQRDFAPVHGLGASPNLIVCAPDRPWRSLTDMVAAARRAPERITFGSTGIGTSAHLGGELLQQAAGIRLTHAPYANGAQAMADTIGGRIDLLWDFPVTAMAHVREGRLRALAVTDDVRTPIAPDVPTTAEAGVPGVVMLAWAGVAVARGTPAEAIARLSAAIRYALLDPRVVEFYNGTATRLWPEMDADGFAAFLAAELPRIVGLIRRAGVRAG